MIKTIFLLIFFSQCSYADLESDINSCYNGFAFGCIGAATTYRFSKQTDYAQAFKYLKKGCETIDNIKGASQNNSIAMACIGVGDLYIAGEGTEKNLPLALEYYKKACNLNYSLGCERYNNYVKRLGKSEAEIKIERIVSECDDLTKDKSLRMLACNALGNIYKKGVDGLKVDYKKSCDYFTKSCEIGDPNGCFEVGGYYNYGIGVKQNKEIANKFYKKAVDAHLNYCQDNDEASCYSLGNSYMDGIGVKQDYQKAKTYFEKSCNNTMPLGCIGLGELYLKGKGVEKDFTKAVEFFKKGCKKSLPICSFVGRAYSQDGENQNLKIAKEYFLKACDGGFKDACEDYRILNKKGY